MKKIICVLLVLVMMLSLTACATKNESNYVAPAGVAVQVIVADFGGLGGHQVGQHRNNACASHGHDGHDLVIITGV